MHGIWVTAYPIQILKSLEKIRRIRVIIVRSAVALIACVAGVAASMEDRAIDIGAIHRIQRGHATQRFELAK